jgi:hypothetical protein
MSDPITQTLSRSFGFQFRNSDLQGTLINLNPGQASVRTDVYTFWAEKEFQNLQDFFSEVCPTQEEQAEILNTINKLIK